MCGHRGPAYGAPVRASLPSEVSATRRRRPHADGEEGPCIVPDTVAAFRIAAQGVAGAAPQEPARSRPRWRHFRASPELPGERASEAQPRHGRHLGRSPRGALARPGRIAPRGRLCADVPGEHDRLRFVGSGRAGAGANARAPGAVSRGRAGSPLERATDQPRRTAPVRALHGSLGAPEADESSPIGVRPAWTQAVDRELGHGRAYPGTPRVSRGGRRGPAPRGAGGLEGAGGVSRALECMASRGRPGSALSSGAIPQGRPAAQLLLDDHHRRRARGHHGAGAPHRIVLPGGRDHRAIRSGGVDHRLVVARAQGRAVRAAALSDSLPPIRSDPSRTASRRHRLTDPRPTRPSAAVVLLRGRDDSLETFWVRRSDAVRYMPGFRAFPGGTADREDAELAIEGMAAGPARTARICAIREAFEETGVLLAPDAVDAGVLEAARTQLLAGAVSFGALVKQHGWRFRSDVVTPAGLWVSPPFAATRFETEFFLARVPQGQEPSVRPGELESGEWVSPLAALKRWQDGARSEEHTSELQSL